MTLDKQVHMMQMTVDALKRKVTSLEQQVEDLKKDSHPPVDIVECIKKAFEDGKFDDLLCTRFKIDRDWI